MNGYLRQSTAAQVRTIGPFLDDTDFKALENALTINNTDIVISINGGADTVKNSGGATAHGAGGIYTLTWDATDTASIGELFYSVKVAGALVVFGTYVVLDEAVYDALFGTTALATATNITAGTITTATNVTTVNGLAANVITATSIAADAITAAKIATGAIDADAIAADAITAAKIANGAIDAATFAAGAIDAAAIADNAIDAGAIAAAALNGKGDWNVGKTGYSLTATTGLGNQTADITGSLSGSVGSVTGAVGSVTGAVGSVTGNVGGNVVGSVGSVTGAVGSVTATVTANMAQISGSTAAADALEESTEAIAYGTVDGTGATTTTFLTSALTPDSAVNDQFNGRVLIFKSDTTTAALRGQATTISDWAHTSAEIGTFTVVALTTAPATGDTFVVL